MKIGVLSGKGGVGKTFASVNLARVIPRAIYLDCDVEEPNGHIFLNPNISTVKDSAIKVPIVDEDKCIACRKCVDFCRFNALVCIKDKIKIFNKICHSCGGCKIVCPTGAIHEENHPIGQVEIGSWNGVKIVTGKLNIGEVSGVPLINSVIDQGELLNNNNESDIIVDCPPGSACSVMETVERVDYCLLVVEPTAFGLHNFKMVYELCKILRKPLGIIINKYEGEYRPLSDFCQENNIDILAKIPFSKNIARTISKGDLLVDINEEYADLFKDIRRQIGGVI